PRTTRTRKPPSAAASHPAFDFSGPLLTYQSNVREADGVNRPSTPQSVVLPGPVGLIAVPVWPMGWFVARTQFTFVTSHPKGSANPSGVIAVNPGPWSDRKETHSAGVVLLKYQTLQLAP